VLAQPGQEMSSDMQFQDFREDMQESKGLFLEQEEKDV